MASFLRAGTQSSSIEVYLRTFEMPVPQAAIDPVVLYAYLAHKLLKPAKEHRLRASLYLRTFTLFEAEAALWLAHPNKDTVEKLMENDDDDPLESASVSLAKAQWERYV
jgi:hypothetical protein